MKLKATRNEDCSSSLGIQTRSESRVTITRKMIAAKL